MKKLSLAITSAPFWTLFFLFLWPLFLLKQSFVYGDYAQQHVPWGLEAWKAIRAGGLPMWTQAMSCGFPLLAEGQCAALYGLNWLGYKCLPFWTAYTLSIPLHFLIGGAGMFLYAKKLRLSTQASVIAATVFCFSSNYAGCFMNTASLRVLCWLPAQLLCIESLSAGNRKKSQILGFVVLSVLVCQQWFAGSAQMSFYALGYLGLYQMLVKGRHRLFYCVAALLLGTLMAWPQLGPTLELIAYSTRHGAGSGFALTGSVPPIAPLSLLYPEWGNMLRYTFYIGIFPFFLGCLFLFVRDRTVGRKHLWIALIFLILSFGKFNPLYRWAVEFLSLTAFRLPSKFLFFTAFSLAVVAGFGWDSLDLILKDKAKKKKFGIFLWVVAVVVLILPALAQALIALFQDGWPPLQDGYIARLVHEKGAAAKPVSYYQSVLSQYLILLQSIFSYRHALNWHAIVLVWAAAATFWFQAKATKPRKLSYVLFCLFLVGDFAVYGYTMSTGFIGNMRALEPQKLSANQARLTQFIQQDPGRLAEFVSNPAQELFLPNAAMGKGLDQVSGYSPLLMKPYYEWAHPAGLADGSLGRPGMQEEAWIKARPILDLAAVRFIHSDHALNWPDLELKDSAENYFVYENTRANSIFKNRVEGPAGKINFPFESSGKELIYLPMMGYPGWNLRIDGVDLPWFSGEGGLMAFQVSKGSHRGELSYSPSAYPAAWVASLIAVAMVIFLAYNMARLKER